MKDNCVRWILAALALYAALTLTRCIIYTPSPGEEAFLVSAFPGYVFWCENNQIVVGNPYPGGSLVKVLPGLYCEPSEEQGPGMNGGKTSFGSIRPARRSPKPPNHPEGSVATTTDDPQPNIFSEALEPANAAATSFQIQDEFPNLLPIPFTPRFTTAGLANYNPTCAPNGSVYVASWASSTVSRIATCPLSVLKTIAMPSNPIQVKLTPDGSTAVVTIYSNAVAFINTANDSSTTLLDGRLQSLRSGHQSRRDQSLRHQL